MAYYPTEPPKDPAALAEWLRLEMQRLARELNAHQDVLRVSEYNQTPEKPRKGDIRLADGTNWDPLSDATQQPVWYDGTRWVGFGGGSYGSGTGLPLRQRDFSLVTTTAYSDLTPSALRDFTEAFVSDTGQFTKYTESSAATFTVTGGQGVVDNTSGAARNDIIVTGSDLTIPQAGVQIDVVSRTGTLGAYSNCAVGIAKDANNFVNALYDDVANTIVIQLKISGVDTRNASVSKSLTPPFKLGFSLVGNSACAYVDEGSGWEFVTGYAIPTATINFKTTSLTGWKRSFTVATPNNQTWTFDNFCGGAFGGTGIRDITVVTDYDGSTYTSGGNAYIAATLADGRGMSYQGVLTFNMTTYAIAQTSVIFIDRGGSKHNDHASCIVRDTSGTTTYRLFTSTWGNGFGGAIDIHYVATTTNILSGTHLIGSTAKLTLPGQDSGYAAYDPSILKDGSTWRLAYVLNPDTSFSPGLFYPATATSTDLSTWTAVNEDAASTPYEGTRIWKLGTDITISAGTLNGVRIYDKFLNFRGYMNATMHGGTDTYPHPQVLDDGTKLILITFNDTKPPGSTATFTWGEMEVHEAP